MKIQLAICDDEEVILNELSLFITDLLKKEDMDYYMDTYHNGGELLESCDKKIYDVVFLDIEMPNTSGIEVAEKIRSYNPFITIIFITNREDLVFNSLRFRPFRFIRKHYLKDELPEAIKSISDKLRSENQIFTVSFNNSSINIRIVDIMYIESYKHDIFIYTTNEKYRIKSKLSKLEKDFEPFGFIRVHSGFLVNYRYIYSVDKTKLLLTNSDMVPLSRYRVETVKQKLQLYARGAE